MTYAILSPTGGPKIVYTDADPSVGVVTVTLPIPSAEYPMEAEYLDESLVKQRRAGKRRIVVTGNRRVFRFGYRAGHLSQALWDDLIGALRQRIVTFYPRTLKAGESATDPSEVEGIICRVKSDIPISAHISMGFDIEIELEEIGTIAPLDLSAYVPPGDPNAPTRPFFPDTEPSPHQYDPSLDLNNFQHAPYLAFYVEEIGTTGYATVTLHDPDDQVEEAGGLKQVYVRKKTGGNFTTSDTYSAQNMTGSPPTYGESVTLYKDRISFIQFKLVMAAGSIYSDKEYEPIAFDRDRKPTWIDFTYELAWDTDNNRYKVYVIWAGDSDTKAGQFALLDASPEPSWAVDPNIVLTGYYGRWIVDTMTSGTTEYLHGRLWNHASSPTLYSEHRYLPIEAPRRFNDLWVWAYDASQFTVEETDKITDQGGDNDLDFTGAQDIKPRGPVPYYTPLMFIDADTMTSYQVETLQAVAWGASTAAFRWLDTVPPGGLTFANGGYFLFFPASVSPEPNLQAYVTSRDTYVDITFTFNTTTYSISLEVKDVDQSVSTWDPSNPAATTVNVDPTVQVSTIVRWGSLRTDTTYWLYAQPFEEADRGGRSGLKIKVMFRTTSITNPEYSETGRWYLTPTVSSVSADVMSQTLDASYFYNQTSFDPSGEQQSFDASPIVSAITVSTIAVTLGSSNFRMDPSYSVS